MIEISNEWKNISENDAFEVFSNLSEKDKRIYYLIDDYYLPSRIEVKVYRKEKNIVVEILRKLMTEQISLYKRTNVVKAEKFSEKIAQLMNAYYNGLITNEEVIKELLAAAEEIANLHKEGEKLGLTTEESLEIIESVESESLGSHIFISVISAISLFCVGLRIIFVYALSSRLA